MSATDLADTDIVFAQRTPVIEADKLEVLGRVGGRGPTYGRLGDAEYILREQPSWRVDDPPQGVVLLGRTVTERDGSGRTSRRRQVLEGTPVPVGRFKALQAKAERLEARRAAEREGSATPRFVDMLALLPALQGRQPSIIPLGPSLPRAEILGGAVLGQEAREDFGVPARKGTTLIIPEEAPSRGIDGAWHHLTAQRGIRFGLSQSGRLALPGSHIAYEDRQVVEALGEDVIVGLLSARPLRCDLPGHKGDAPVAFTVAWPNRLPVCEQHLLGAAE